METITIDLADYRPHPENYNTHPSMQLGELERSLRDFGQFKNVVVWRGFYLAGHGLVAAARRRGETRLAAVDMSHLTEEQARALMIADNRLPQLAVVDDGAYRALLESFDDPLVVPGIDGDYIRQLGLDVNGSGGGDPDADTKPKVDEAPALAKKWGTARGQVWRLGRHMVACGDCQEAHVAAAVADEPADLLFTDPPYGIDLIEAESGRVGGGTKEYPTRQFAKIAGDAEPFDPGHLLGVAPQLIIWGGNYFADLLPVGRCWFIWDKRHPVDRTFAGCELAWTNLDRHAKIFPVTWDGWTKQGESGSKLHPTQKPVKLCSDILAEVEGQVVADYYLGSGSTLIAAENLGRSCRGVELVPEYVAVTLERWAEHTGRQPQLVGSV